MRALSGIAATLLVLAVVASVAHAGARLTWRIAGLDAPPAPRVAPVAQAPAPPDIAPVLALAPFGTRVLAPEPEPVETARPDDGWLLDLTLQGVITAVPASRSMAILAVREEGVRTFAVGESPLRGVTLAEVRRDGVVLSAAGGETFLGFASEADRQAAAVTRLRNLVPEQFRGPASGPAGATSRTRSTDEIIDYYRQRIAANPQTVLDGFGVRVVEGGYEIGPDPSIGVTRAGLRPGDVIARVNGEAVGDIEADRHLYEKIAASGHARVEILRGGRRVILSFPLK